MATPAGLNRARTAGVLLGIGLGGFLDGILLRPIMQWHHMLSRVLPPTDMHAMHVNMLWDGLFHLAVWLATLVGVSLVWGARRRCPPDAAAPLAARLAADRVGRADRPPSARHPSRARFRPDPVSDIGFLLTGPLLVPFGGWLYRSADLSRTSDLQP
jgi:uncharacterized membrane protein